MGGIGEWYAQVFSLAPGIAAGEVRVTEQARGRVAEGGVAERLVAVGPLAHGKIAAPTLLALTAGDRERDDDPVSDLERGVVLADLDDLAHRLVAQDVARLHAGHEVVVEVQVGSADRAARHLDDGVSPLLDRRIRRSCRIISILNR